MKKIAIIGGGISGLAVLHYLKQRFSDTVEIALYERNAKVGGAIASLEHQGFIFESGPNGFLNNQPITLEFIREVGFEGELIEAQESFKRRYVQRNNKLIVFPKSLSSFIQSEILTTAQKIRLIQGLWKKNISKDQSIEAYITERFGSGVAQQMVDPFLTGVYAGDIKRLHMHSAFPQLGSRKGKVKLCSFKKGMGSLMAHLANFYQAHIHLDERISDVSQIKADQIIICTPAYVTAQILKQDVFNEIFYVPVAVVGLLFKKSAFKSLPDGFGYLIPSSEGKDILGVLLESNIFARQTATDELFVRVMIGGRHHPEVADCNVQDLIHKALKELQLVYGVTEEPLDVAVKSWTQGIPQYELNYPYVAAKIDQFLSQYPHIHICANYWGGISFNDCIKNAKNLAKEIEIS